MENKYLVAFFKTNDNLDIIQNNTLSSPAQKNPKKTKKKRPTTYRNESTGNKETEMLTGGTER